MSKISRSDTLQHSTHTSNHINHKIFTKLKYKIVNLPHLKYSDLAAKIILWPLKWVFSTTRVMSAYSSWSTSSPKFSDSDTMWSTMPTGAGDRRWWWSHILSVQDKFISCSNETGRQYRKKSRTFTLLQQLLMTTLSLCGIPENTKKNT